MGLFFIDLVLFMRQAELFSLHLYTLLHSDSYTVFKCFQEGMGITRGGMTTTFQSSDSGVLGRWDRYVCSAVSSNVIERLALVASLLGLREGGVG